MRSWVCLIGWHLWSAWVKRSTGTNKYNIEYWTERKCQRCGKIQTRDLFYVTEGDLFTIAARNIIFKTKEK